MPRANFKGVITDGVSQSVGRSMIMKGSPIQPLPNSLLPAIQTSSNMTDNTKLFLGPVPVLSNDFPFRDLATATALTPSLSPNTYLADLRHDWAIGMVPHGGYLAALITGAAKVFSAEHHSDQKQVDLVTLHQEFISACVFGPAEVTVTVLSRGRQYSTLRIQLFQHPGHDRTKKAILRIEALVRQGSLSRESASGGLSLPTLPTSKFGPILDRASCIERQDPAGLFERRTAYQKVVFMLGPETNEVGKGAEGPSVRTQWIRWRDEMKRIDIMGLSFLADTHRPLIEAYGVVGNWFPTLSMSLDVKKAPPPEGWEWLFMRIEMHQVKDGRFDYDVVILDEEGELVATSRHANLSVSSERNYKRSSAATAKM